MRKRYFIKSFQAGLVGKFVVLVLLESALIFGLFMFLAKDTITTGYAGSILTLDSSPNFFFIPFIALCVIVMICVSVSGLIAFMFMSHRVAGPVYRFEKVLEALNQGDLTVGVPLRKNDDCAELRKALEDFIRSLDRRVTTMKTDVDALDALLGRADAAGSADQIRKTIASLKNELDHFKVSSKNKDGQ